MSDSQLNTVQNAENQTQLTSDIKTGVENNIAQPNKTVQDFLALGAATFNISEATFSTNITNEFVNAIRHTTTNICESIFQSTDNYVMTICGDLENTTINLNQNATVTALTSCINKVLQGTSLNRVLTQMDQSTEQRGLGSSLMWIPIIGGIILLLLIVGLMIWFFLQKDSGDGGSTTQIYTGSLEMGDYQTLL